MTALGFASLIALLFVPGLIPAAHLSLGVGLVIPQWHFDALMLLVPGG